ncbi:MAG: SpoIIE family protein phosphatase [SAR324 cluster bacterium]|nr:SpoIIE family protein phosphatase [SAR324 cluster bacterium]
MNSEKLNLLIVDDETAVAQTLFYILRKEYHVTSAASSEEAWELLKQGKVFDIFLVDERLPGIQGHELLQKIAEHYEKSIRLLITGYTDIESLIKAINDGHIYGYIKKPFELAELRHAIKSAADFYRLYINNGVLTEQLEQLNQQLEQRIEDRTQELRESQKRLSIVYDITKSVSSTLNLEEATQLFIQQTVDAIRPDGSGSILLYREKDNVMVVYASHGLDPQYTGHFEISVSPDTLYTYDVFASQQSKIFSLEELRPFQNEQTLRLHYGKSYVQQLVVPLVFQQRSIGLVTISHYTPDILFSNNDQNLLESLTRILANHFENASLYEESQHKEQQIREINERVQRDLTVASEFQRAILPDIKETPYLKMVTRYLPLDKVSGDVYDWSYNRDGALNIFLGDATGHGVAAAFMTMMANIGLDQIRPNLPPDEVLRKLNTLLASRDTGLSVTGVFLRIEPDGKLTTANAAHPPMVILPKDQKSCVLLGEGGCALGMFLEEIVPYVNEQYQLQEGDKLFIFTDGITEWESNEGELYGQDRLIEFLDEFRNDDMDNTLGTLIRSLFLFGYSPGDDVTIIGFQYRKPE